jgi:Zn-dependent M28 family amino/carboxypeptidase
MRDSPTDALVGRVWRDTLPWEFLTALTEIGDRLGGGPGERRAANLLVEAFEHATADPTIEPFSIQRWHRGTTSLTVRVPAADSGDHDATDVTGTDDSGDHDDPAEPAGSGGSGESPFAREESIERSFEASALPYSPAGKVRGRLVDVGSGTPAEIDAADVKGAIAVTGTTTPSGQRYVHRMEKFGHAVESGALGVCFANHVPGQLPPTGSLTFDLEADAPGAGVSAETGAWLREYAGRGGEATLEVEARTEAGTSRNVVGTIGPDTEEEIVVLAHYDAHDVAEGALDNGCGVAVLVTAARLLAGFDLDRTIRVVATSCEELGLVGAETLADALDPDRIKAVVNIDGAGRFRDLQAIAHGSTDLGALVTHVLNDAGHPLALEPSPHPYSDHWPFLRAGVPTVQFHSERPGSSGQWERGWTHTRADTREKADPRDLREHAILIALFVRELTREAVAIDRVPPAETRERLREAGAEPGMRAAGIWPEEW